MKQKLLEKLKTGIEPIGLDEQYKAVYDLIEQTVVRGTSNSLMITGPRGSGKSMILDQVLKSLKHEFIVIQLNGLIHTNDRLALKAIQSQLNIHEENINYSFQDTFALILKTLSSGSNETIPVVFVLDELDLIAQHPKQLLLYNLFDIAQSSKSPISVVGLTSRSDTLMLFEKRVKSRFGHRQVDFYPPSTEDLFEICKKYLTFDDPVTEQEKEWNDQVAVFLKETKSFWSDYFDLWNDVPHLKQFILNLLCQMEPDDKLDFDLMEKVMGQDQRDLGQETIQDLSLLQVCLVVAAMKLIKNQEHEMNFEMVYDEFRQFTGRIANIGRGLGRFQFTKKAFEGLEEAGILRFETGASSKCPKEYKSVRMLLTRGQLEEAIGDLKGLPDHLRKWATTN